MKIGLMIFGAVVLGVILLIGSDIIAIETSGCTLPIDLVAGDLCLFGSLGASVGLTLLAIIGFGLLSLVWGIIKKLSR